MQHNETQLAHTPRRAAVYRPGDPESGVVLLAVIFLTFLLLLSLAIAAPNIAKSLQRQKEEETIQRGMQYEQAIRLYYIKFGHYPTKMKDLLDTNNMRFLRQEYKDPLTGKNDWKLVLYGQAHVHPLGFFGKPLTAAGAAATNVTALSGGMYAISQNSSIPGAPGSSDNDQSFGSDNSNSGSTTSANNASTDGFGNDSGSSFGSTSGFGSTTSGGFSGASSSDGNGFGSNIPFVGVVPPLNKPSIIAFRKQTNYDHWEFNYDPVVDQAAAAVSLLGGGSNNLNGSNSTNNTSNGNGSNGGFSFGNDNGRNNDNGSGNDNSGFGDSNNNSGSNSSSGDSSNNDSTQNPQQ